MGKGKSHGGLHVYLLISCNISNTQFPTVRCSDEMRHRSELNCSVIEPLFSLHCEVNEFILDNCWGTEIILDTSYIFTKNTCSALQACVANVFFISLNTHLVKASCCIVDIRSSQLRDCFITIYF